MPLSLGTRLGVYEVSTKIGEGGMGEVWQARDTKLDWEVALKVLPEAFTADPDRLARFEREAKVLVSLNHPNIGSIYGLEEAEGVKALVLELVEGPTLADRISKGPIPIDEALPIAKQIAEALEAAHEAGVIHRDLKPANIKVREDGTVKVLDFGLAKALAGDVPDADLSQSPTVTASGTREGVILGTAAYMSPEQARGKPLDKKTDIWSFGCVLYEMLAGSRAFKGGDIGETLAAVIKDEPDYDDLFGATPSSIRRLLQRCLAKDRQERLQSIGDARLDLRDAMVDGTIEPGPVVSTPLHRTAWTLSTGVLIGVAAAVLTFWATPPSVAPNQPVSRLVLTPPPGEMLSSGAGRIIAISPDGTRVAYVAGQRIYLQALDRLSPVALPGTEGVGSLRGGNLTFSPDGEWVGFTAGGQLKRVSVSGGSPVAIGSAFVQGGTTGGVNWAEPDRILLAQGLGGVWQVTSDGGQLERLVSLAPGEHAMGPQSLDDGRLLLFTLRPPSPASWDEAQVVVEALATGERTVLVERGWEGRYLPTGHLVFMLGGTLFAQPMDLASLVVSGTATPVIEGIGTEIAAANFSVSDSGTLAYVTGGNQADARTLVWVDRSGEELALGLEPLLYNSPRVSPDGSAIAVEVATSGRTDVRVYDLRRHTLTRITVGPERDFNPLWSPDGRTIVFGSTREGGGLFRKPADGTGQAELL